MRSLLLEDRQDVQKEAAWALANLTDGGEKQQIITMGRLVRMHASKLTVLLLPPPSPHLAHTQKPTNQSPFHPISLFGCSGVCLSLSFVSRHFLPLPLGINNFLTLVEGLY